MSEGDGSGGITRRGGQRTSGPKFGTYIPETNPKLSKAYAKFYDSLTPKQLEALGGRPDSCNPTAEIRPESKNATNPDDWEYYTNGEANRKQQNIFAKAICHIDADPIEPGDADAKTNHLHIILVMEVLRKVLKVYEVASDQSTKLHGEVVALALGFPGLTVSTLAKKYGCTRQAVSKRLRRVVTALNLPPTYRMIVHGTDMSLLAMIQKGASKGRMARLRGKPTPPLKTPLKTGKQL